jgi:ADP-ribosylglycohydrolase
LAAVRPEYRERYAVVLAPSWEPRFATEFNGAVWPCLGCAVWAVRGADSFESALRAAVDVGGDTDTVAAVAGALAGARYGIDAVPERWIRALHVPVPGWQDRVLRARDLGELASRLFQRS